MIAFDGALNTTLLLQIKDIYFEEVFAYDDFLCSDCQE